MGKGQTVGKVVGGSVSRREFAAFGAAAAFAGCTGMSSGSIGDIAETAVTVPAEQGSRSGYFIHPANGRHPGVVLWSGAIGLRDAHRDVARQMAAQGWSVLVVDSGNAGHSAQRLNRDAKAHIAWLESQSVVAATSGSGRKPHQIADGYVLKTIVVSKRSALVAVADNKQTRGPRQMAALRDMVRAATRVA